MLPILATAGHTYNVKGARLYVLLIIMNMNTAKRAAADNTASTVHKFRTGRLVEECFRLNNNLPKEERFIQLRGGLTVSRLSNNNRHEN